MSGRPAPWPVRAALGTAAGCTTATALYALIRVGQAILFAEPNPALVIWSEHAGFFWRSLTVGYVGGMVGIVTAYVARERAETIALVIAKIMPFAAAILAAQSLFVP